MMMMSQYIHVQISVLNIRTDEFCLTEGLCEFSEGTLHLPFDYIHYQSLTDNEEEFTVSLLTYTSTSYDNVFAEEHKKSKCH